MVAAESIMSRVAFLMLTEEVGRAPLQIGDDARWNGGSSQARRRLDAIEGAQGAFVAVQDEAGLFNLNATRSAGVGGSC